MKINMDGLRRNLTGDFAKLTEMIGLISAINKDYGATLLTELELDEILEKHDKVAQGIGLLNCVYDDNEENFTDLSQSLNVTFLLADKD